MRSSIASPLRIVLALALGAPPALAPTEAISAAIAPASERDQSQRLLAEGDVLQSKGEWSQALSKYRASYDVLRPEDQAAYFGSLPMRQAMLAYGRLIANEQDPAKRRSLLERQRVLLDEFLDAVAAKPGAAEDVGEEELAALQQTRREIQHALEGEQPPPDVPPQVPVPEDDPRPTAELTSTSTPTTADRPSPSVSPTPRRDWLGLGLVIGGSTTLAAGLGLGVGYFSIRSGAQALVDAGGEEYAPGTPAREDYLDREYGRAQKFLIAGSVVAGVGLGIAIGGIVRLVVHRRKASSDIAMRVSPILTPTTAGLALHHRF